MAFCCPPNKIWPKKKKNLMSCWGRDFFLMKLLLWLFTNVQFSNGFERIKAPSTCCIENAFYNSLRWGAPFKVQNKAIKFIIFSDCIVLYVLTWSFPFFVTLIINQVIKELTNGGADHCFECIGLASLMQEAFLSSRKVLSLSQLVCFFFF